MFLIQSMQISIVFIVDKLENFRLKINVKEERKKEKRTLDNSTINIFMSRGMGSRENESFTDNFCSYDFTGIFHNDESSDDSDIEIDLESVDVVKDDDDEEKLTK